MPETPPRPNSGGPERNLTPALSLRKERELDEYKVGEEGRDKPLPLLLTPGSYSGPPELGRGGFPFPLFLATGNAGKVAEFRALLAPLFGPDGLTLHTPRDWRGPLPDVAETGATFEENARLKAVALAQATGLPALADDSGLCVDALGGAPGLLSARWAGPGATDADRNAKLRAALADVPAASRTARFVCAVALALPDGTGGAAEGACEGLIAEDPRGAEGFGYDPLFLLPALGRTMAELTPSEKDALSHRALALRRLAPALLAARARFAGAGGRV